jgi:hypothetical protein
MDEFDSIPRLARVWLEKEEAASAISFFGEMVSVFEEPRVRGVICGHYKSVHDFYSLRHMHHHTALANTKLTKYFGFSSEEFNVLCDHFEVPTEHREKLTSW